MPLCKSIKVIFVLVLARCLVLAQARSWDFRILILRRSLGRSLRLFLLFRIGCFRRLVGLAGILALHRIVNMFVMSLLVFRICMLLGSLIVA